MSSMEPRGFHAHKELNQLMCVLNGTINLKLSRGEEVYNFSISAGEPLIYIPKGTWREIYCEQESSSLMVFADDDYHESDYIRDWHEYLSWSKDNI